MAKQKSPGTHPFREVVEASERFALAEVSEGATVEFVGRVQRWEQGRFVLLLPAHDDWGVLAVELDIGDVQEAEPIFEDSAGRKTYRVSVPSGSMAKLVFRAPDLTDRLAAQRDHAEPPEPVEPWRFDLARQEPVQHAKPARLAPVRAVRTGQRAPRRYERVQTGPQRRSSYGHAATPQRYPPRTAAPPRRRQDPGYYPQPVQGQSSGYGPAEHDPGLYQPYESGYGGSGSHDPAQYQAYEPGYRGHPGYDPDLYQPYERGYGGHPEFDPAYYQPGKPGYGTPAEYDPAYYQPGEPSYGAPVGYDPAYYQSGNVGYGPSGTDPAQYQHYQAGAYGHGTPGQYDPYATGEYDSYYPGPHDPYR